ncbi:MAG: serpin family protein [Bacteroidales bacterium]|nr:serpin family protein [Bacteroidales bacterium]
MRKVLCVLCMIMFLFFSCEKDEDPLQTMKKINITKTTGEIIAADNAFGLELFQKVLAGDADAKNVFVSPTSVAMALAMTYNGADGETRTAMEHALKKNGFTVEEINTSYKSLIEALVSVDPKVLFEIANSIWYRLDFTVLPDFVSVNQEYYDAEVSALDFSLPSASETINGWVADKTHDKITEIIRDIPGDVVMYLINAIYFKGIWQYEFDDADTHDDVFKLKDGSPVAAPFMQQEAPLPYASNELFSMIEMPYGQGNYNMVVILPQTSHTTDEVAASLTTENWESWLNALTEQKVLVQLPKFKFEYENLLNDELSVMGMGVAFTPQADFSKINGSGGIWISRVIHKTFVEVNEEGTEAAAVTAVEMVESIGPGPDYVLFRVDRPFIFAIREKYTGTIIFIGCVQDPLSRTNK